MKLKKELDLLQFSKIRGYTALANETPGCIKLTIGEPDFDTPEEIKTAAVKALAEGKTHYAQNQGLPALRQAIAEAETRRGNVCTAEQVLITVGATGALYTALTGILEPGDQVIIPQPAFPVYESITLAAGGEVVPLPLRDFQIESIEELITPKTRAIVLNSPNNPSGTVLNRDSLEQVKKAVFGKDIWIICDNVYNQLCETPVYDLSLDPQLRDQVMVCQSFSKPYAMTGWRIGYLVAPEQAMGRLLLLQAAQIASVPTFLQEACITALKTDVSYMKEAYYRRRALVCCRLEEMNIPFPKPEGAFYIFADIRKFGLTSDDFCRRMIKEAGVAAVPGSCFGSEGFVRFSCACSEEQLEEAMDRIEKFTVLL